MQLRRWLGMVALAPVLMFVLFMFFFVGDSFGLKDTPAIRMALVGTAITAFLIGWWLGRRWPLRHATWFLPVGAVVTMAPWLLVRRPDVLSRVEVATVLAVCIAALAAVAVVTAALARRSASAATAFAGVGTSLLVVLLPFLAVGVGVGAAMAPWNSAATWTLAGLTDDPYLGNFPLRHATQIAGIFAVLVATSSAYVLGYVIGVRRPAVHPPVVYAADASFRPRRNSHHFHPRSSAAPRWPASDSPSHAGLLAGIVAVDFSVDSRSPHCRWTAARREDPDTASGTCTPKCTLKSATHSNSRGTKRTSAHLDMCALPSPSGGGNAATPRCDHAAAPAPARPSRSGDSSQSDLEPDRATCWTTTQSRA